MPPVLIIEYSVHNYAIKFVQLPSNKCQRHFQHHSLFRITFPSTHVLSPLPKGPYSRGAARFQNWHMVKRAAVRAPHLLWNFQTIFLKVFLSLHFYLLVHHAVEVFYWLGLVFICISLLFAEQNVALNYATISTPRHLCRYCETSWLGTLCL